ncbi:hypothetical protein T10_12389 [Trichinella papuae]|uniref:Uncharacterized protein n=1 Tax=Trichinella papuae TaxID=268474 RepID=A0A0V1MUB8_9BILA|nr:hypothetical protein T10_12389 [Trichinella papuae]
MENMQRMGFLSGCFYHGIWHMTQAMSVHTLTHLLQFRRLSFIKPSSVLKIFLLRKPQPTV